MTLVRFLGTGQTDGTTVTVANSDDFGEKLDVVSKSNATGTPTPAASILAYSNLHVATSGMSIKCFVAPPGSGGSGATALFGLNMPVVGRKLAAQFCLYLTAYPAAETLIFETRRSPDAYGPSLHLTTDGKLMPEGKSVISAQKTASPLPLNTLLMIDVLIDMGTTASNGSIKFAYRTFGDASPTEEKTASGLDLWAVDAGQVRFGKVNSAGDLPTAYVFAASVDNGATTYIPKPTSLDPLAVSLAITPTSGTKPLTVDATATATGGTGTNEFTFTWDDGSTTGPQPGNTASHTYTTPGTYNATVTATDS